jgi:hypothetical protein
MFFIERNPMPFQESDRRPIAPSGTSNACFPAQSKSAVADFDINGAHRVSAEPAIGLAHRVRPKGRPFADPMAGSGRTRLGKPDGRLHRASPTSVSRPNLRLGA